MGCARSNRTFRCESPVFVRKWARGLATNTETTFVLSELAVLESAALRGHLYLDCTPFGQFQP
jgi:hypothetical protein